MKRLAFELREWVTTWFLVRGATTTVAISVPRGLVRTCELRLIQGTVDVVDGQDTSVRGKLTTTTTTTRYLISVSSLNIGRYIEITIVPTIAPTPIIRIGSMIEVSEAMLASTSSS